jgi:carbon monoxide dehydrogenase subunit G
MKIEETFRVRAPIDRVWGFITDPGRVAPCIPGCGNVEVLGENDYRASVKVGIGPIKTSFQVAIELTRREAPTYLATVTRGEEGGKASTLSAHSELRLSPVASDETEVHYASEVSVFGRLGRFGLGMMKKKAKEIGDEFAESLRAQLEAPR